MAYPLFWGEPLPLRMGNVFLGLKACMANLRNEENPSYLW